MTRTFHVTASTRFRLPKPMPENDYAHEVDYLITTDCVIGPHIAMKIMELLYPNKEITEIGVEIV